MIPEEIISKLDLLVTSEQYGDSLNTGAQMAVFKKDSTISFYDGDILGSLYSAKYYRVEKKLHNKAVSLFVFHENIIGAGSDIADRIISKINSPTTAPRSIFK